ALQRARLVADEEAHVVPGCREPRGRDRFHGAYQIADVHAGPRYREGRARARKSIDERGPLAPLWPPWPRGVALHSSTVPARPTTVIPVLDAELDRHLDGLYAEHVADLERRYSQALEAHGWDAVVLHSGSLVKRSAFDDQYWPLRPVPHWQHWLPLAEPDGALVVRIGQRPKLWRLAARSFWERPPPPPTRAFLDVFDVDEVADPADVKLHLGGGRVACIGEDRARAASWGLGATAASATAPLAAELDLLGPSFGCASQDDWQTPYKNIVALDENAATLHHVAYGRRSEPREAASLLVDAGATCRGYGADVTRTWVKGSGAAANAFAELVASVE